jgi:glutathione S-transferase
VWFEEFADTIVVAAAGPLFFNRIVGPRFMGVTGDENACVKAERETIPPLLDYLEGLAPDAGGFLLEDRITLADIAVASPFANLGHLSFDLSAWPRTKAYVEAILARPSFADRIVKEKRLLGA